MSQTVFRKSPKWLTFNFQGKNQLATNRQKVIKYAIQHALLSEKPDTFLFPHPTFNGCSLFSQLMFSWEKQTRNTKKANETLTFAFLHFQEKNIINDEQEFYIRTKGDNKGASRQNLRPDQTALTMIENVLIKCRNHKVWSSKKQTNFYEFCCIPGIR